MQTNHKRLTFNLAYLAILRISAIRTAFVAASSKSSVSTMLNPESAMICCAYSILVPFILSTIGFFIPRALIPLIKPNAITSALHLKRYVYLAIPPKMFTKIDSTFGSLSMIFRAATTCSSVALPPTSKKLAGFPFFS